MGDKSRMVIYSTLLNFLEEHGIDLSEFGSAERGLFTCDAVSFLQPLMESRQPVMGIEPWRKAGSTYQCDSLGVWASEPGNVTQINAKANWIIEQLDLGENDVVTIQF